MVPLLRVWILLGILYITEGVNNSLKLVHVFFRHGHRTPTYNEIDPDDSYSFQKDNFLDYGQLTNRGKQESYNLGQLLKTQYDSFLGNVSSLDMIEAYSTDYDRTKMTVLSVLAAMFPPSGKEWNSGLKWQPIPYKYLPCEMDHLLTKTELFCPKYDEELKKLHLTEGEKLLQMYRPAIEQISRNTGKNRSSINVLYGLNKFFMAEVDMNQTLPEWTRAIYPYPLREIVMYRHKLSNYNTFLKRVNGGKILRMILKHMQKKVADDDSLRRRKMYLYGVHDLTLYAILSILKLKENEIPKFNSAILIELHNLPHKDKYAVKVLYVDGVGANPVEQKLPECDILCPLDDFDRILKPYLPQNMTKECDSKIDLEAYEI